MTLNIVFKEAFQANKFQPNNSKNTPNFLPEVSLSTTPKVLIESEGTVGKVNLSLSEAPPVGGVTVTVTAPEILEFNLESLAVTGGEIVVPPVASDLFGFTINITEQDATVSLAVADDGQVEGLEAVTFTLEEPLGLFEPTFQVNPEANRGTFLIADTPKVIPIQDSPDSLPEVSLSTSPKLLIESEGTVANVNLSLSESPPVDGVTVTVTAPEILEFNLDSLAVTGGEIVVPPVASDLFGFTINITEQDATVSLAVADDGQVEGLEAVIFTLEEPLGLFEPTFEVNPEANRGIFVIVDSLEIFDDYTLF